MYKLIVLTIMFTLCSCSSVSSLPIKGNSTEQPIITEDVFPTALTATEYPLPASTPDEKTLSYHVYIESKQGATSEAFGVCPEILGQSMRGPYPPKVDSGGNLYVFDRVNLRILKYFSGSIVQTIMLPRDIYPGNPCEDSNLSPPNISISGERIFALFSQVQKDSRIADRLAIFSTSGQQKQVMNLDAYYPLRSIYRDFLVPDRQGGGYLLLPPLGILYLDKSLQTELISINSDIGFVYENIVTGWDKFLYVYDPSNNRIVKWRDYRHFSIGSEPLDAISNAIIIPQALTNSFQIKFIGADIQGRYYFAIGDAKRTLWLERLSASGEVKEVTAIPTEMSILQNDWEIGPDGALYTLFYQSGQPAPEPIIIKCSFE